MSLKKILDSQTRQSKSYPAKIFAICIVVVRDLVLVLRKIFGAIFADSKSNDEKVKNKPKSVKRYAATTPPGSSGDTFIWPTLGKYDFTVVGTSFHQTELASLVAPHGDRNAEFKCMALLTPYLYNDSPAVKVTINNTLIGHLSADEARSFRKRLGAKKLGLATSTCGAIIDGGFVKKNGERATYWAKLDIKPFS